MRMRIPCRLDTLDSEAPFPHAEMALREPDGLLAVGGDLSPQRLLCAYRSGIFPWYNSGQPILWWSPDPRSILHLHELQIARSLAKVLRKGEYSVTFDYAFAEVIQACAELRSDGLGSWITPAMQRAYIELHAQGHAHSVESWRNGELVGGLYGIALGRVFFGESMFSRARDASKVALVHLTQHLQAAGFGFIDCQVHSEHLQRMGAAAIPRREFLALLQQWCSVPPVTPAWSSMRQTPAVSGAKDYISGTGASVA